MARPQHLGNFRLNPAPKQVRAPVELEDERSRALYRTLVRHLGQHEHWSAGFESQVLLFCETEQLYRTAREEVGRVGFKGEDRPSIAYQVMDKERRVLMQLGKALGLTPQTLATMLRGGVANPGRAPHRPESDPGPEDLIG